MSQADTTPWTCVDDFVEAYESSRELGDKTSVLDFLPPQDHSLYRQVASELIRVEMEFSWNEGQNKRLSDYQELLPDVLDDLEVLRQVAFEEYRLRVQAGEKASAEAYGSQYGIETSDWPRWETAERAGNSGEDTPTNRSPRVGEMWQEALELADGVQSFPTDGEEFLGFLLQRELGRGAFARVFLAQQGELSDRLVVLKVASGHSLEPQHLARLQHTNIVPIYSVHRREQLTAVCMPYFGERTLADLLVAIKHNSASHGSPQNLISTFLNRGDPTRLMEKSQPGTEISASVAPSSEVSTALAESNHVDAVVWLIKQLAEGIAHAHRRGIVHRDLKPANVLLTDEGLPMILDFNLSEEVVVNGRASLLVGGTLPYMSPEHLESVLTGAKIGPQTDIFSLGVIFFELLAGRRPFPDHHGAFDDIVQKMIADREQEVPSVIAANPSVPRSIASVVEKCLSTDVRYRYRLADELAEDLGRHLSHQRLRYAADKSMVERGKKWLKRHPKVSSGGGVAAIAGVFLLMILSLWFLRGERLARLEAEKTFDTFRQQQPLLSMAIAASQTETEYLAESMDSTRTALGIYGILTEQDWRNKKAYTALSQADRKHLDDRLGELLFLLARANEKLSHAAQDAAKRSKLAEVALQLNHLAIERFSKQTCPQGLLLQRANLLAYQGSSEAAEELRQQAINQPRGSVIDQYSQVYKLLDAHDFREAKPLLTTLRDRNPTDPVPWLMLGDANAAISFFNESEGCYTTAVALRPQSQMALLHRGLCRMDQQKYKAALADFEAVITLRPELMGGYLNRATAHTALRKPQAAIADLTKALDLGATQTRIYFLRSKLRQQVGDQEGAKEDLSKGLETTPTDELSWIARGIARLKTDPTAALSDFQQALKLNPVSISALRNLVHTLADRLDKPREAMKSLNQILALRENDSEALAGRAVLYARQENRQAALADMQQLLQGSKNPRAIFQAACTLSLLSDQQAGDLNKAMILLSRAVQLEPSWLARAHSDPDLKNLRQTDAYKSFVENYRDLALLKMSLSKRP